MTLSPLRCLAFAAALGAPLAASAQEVPRRPDVPPVTEPADSLDLPGAGGRAAAIAVPGLSPAARAVPAGALTLSLVEAEQIAIERAYAVRTASLEVDRARAQVREAYGGLYPRLDASSSYTRNVVQANPFAGSSAGNLFGGLGAIGWLQFNETARTDDDPATVPITLDEYTRRVGAGQQAIGYNPANSSNPFGTDNAFVNSLAISQPLYSPTAFAAVKGARGLVEINEAATEQRVDETLFQVRQAFYTALLADQQLAVQRASAQRARETAGDAALLVAQGVRPKLERLNAEVDLANTQTQVTLAEVQAEDARDRLLLALGLPVGTPVVLEGDLLAPPPELFRTAVLAPGEGIGTADIADDLGALVDDRPDVRQAALAIRLQEVQRNITRAATKPSASAFANLSYSGNVPDDRTSVFNPDPADPFTFQEDTAGFFSDAYWQPAVSVGLRLNWTLFDGFQTRYRAQQNQISIDQAEIAYEQARNAATQEVAAAARALRSAERRLTAQGQTVETAETAYRFASARLEEGVATQVDVRVASQNLDLARLNYLQTVYDALVARSAYERATGAITPGGLPAPSPTTAAR